jgi:hypothetical protein
MFNEIPSHAFVRRLCVCSAVGLLLLTSETLVAQQAQPTTEVQRQAMQKLGFLAGRWSGPVTIIRGPGDPLRLTQTENVQFKLGGVVLLIEGQSTGTDGKAQFQALATVSYDEASHTYRIRAYNDGHYLDTELMALPDGFAWGFDSGPAHIQNAMHLTAQGEWQEATEVVLGSNPPRHSVEMLLQRQP